jgi:hypothetical protein
VNSKIFFIIAALLLFALLSSPSPSDASDAASINYQTEAGFKITRAAASSVLNRNNFKVKDRSDFYVDIYDGKHFVLNENLFKLRLKSTADKWKVQANTKTTILPSQCAQGWPYNVLVKKIGELKLDNKTRQHFEKAVSSQLDLITIGSAEAVQREIYSFDHFIRGLPVPLLDVLMKIPNGNPWFFVASYQSEKKKWIAKISIEDKEVEVSIGEVREFVGNTFIGSNYEIEFQFKNEDMSIAEFKSAVCSFLQQSGFSKHDFTYGSADPQPETLRRLKRYNAVLGF